MYASMQRLALTFVIAIAIVGMTASTGGCSSYKYRTPGGPAEMALFVDRDIRAEFERAPAATAPAYLALVRVQQSGYRAYEQTSFGSGRFSIVTVRDSAEEASMRRVQGMPQLAQAAWLNRLLLPEQLNSEKDLRVAAASLRADMLLIYTYDTRFHTGDAAAPITVLTLGFSPHQQVTVNTTVSAVLMDVRTGYVYGVCEGNSAQQKLASAWTSEDQVDRSRRATEGEAFDGMIVQFEKLWPEVVAGLPPKTGTMRYATSSKADE